MIKSSCDLTDSYTKNKLILMMLSAFNNQPVKF
jgi:hypothetical protein